MAPTSPSAAGRARRRCADPRHHEQVVGGDGHPAAAPQVLGEHVAQAVVARTGAGVVAGHRRCRHPPGPAPGGLVDERGVGPPRAQVPARRCGRAPLRGGTRAAGGVHVGEGAGGRGPVGTRSHDGPRTRPADDEPRRGQLVVGRDDRAAGQAERSREGPGRGERVARAQPPGAQLADHGVGQPVAQGCRAVGDVEGEVDGAWRTRHPPRILVLRNWPLVDLGEVQFEG